MKQQKKFVSDSLLKAIFKFSHSCRLLKIIWQSIIALEARTHAWYFIMKQIVLFLCKMYTNRRMLRTLWKLLQETFLPDLMRLLLLLLLLFLLLLLLLLFGKYIQTLPQRPSTKCYHRCSMEAKTSRQINNEITCV